MVNKRVVFIALASGRRTEEQGMGATTVGTGQGSNAT